MKARKRILAFVLAMLMLIACCASCGNTSDGSESTKPSESNGTELASGSESETDSAAASESESTSETAKKPVKPGYEPDLPNLKDSIASKDGLGEDAIVGCVLNSGTISNKNIMALAKKHFNAVTFENETKPDPHFGYASKPELVEYDLNGKKVMMPKLNFGADKMLNVLKSWNEANPDNKIRVRGHTLVWHAQTPEFFFHEDFDESKPYASVEVMDEREEWYIKTVLEHYHGPDSPYQGMFYAWDVVNEAASDGGGADGGYRTDKEGTPSRWWAIYQSNKYLVNAFVYANKYAPADIDLYYNDYGDTDPNKVKRISKILSDVKATEGARIDGMGMQAHYGSSNPSKTELENAIRAYSKIVDKVMLTEFDRACSNLYKGTDATREYEYMNHGKQWNGFYEVLKKLEKEDGINIAGITFWGVSDNNSWIQETVNGKYTKCPLLFDINYKAKPAFWAFVDPDRMHEMFD